MLDITWYPNSFCSKDAQFLLGLLTMLSKQAIYTLRLLLLSHFSRVRLCATPKTAAHQAPLSLGFSRQEYWSGLPFPSPMHESENEVAAQSYDSSRPHGLQPTRLLCPWDVLGKSTGVGCRCLLQPHMLVMLKILQARLQQCVNHELPDVQAGSRKGRGTRDQIANICWIIEKTREFQINIYFCFIDYAKAFECVDHNKLENSSRDGNTRPPDLPLEKSVCRSRSNC